MACQNVCVEQVLHASFSGGLALTPFFFNHLCLWLRICYRKPEENVEHDTSLCPCVPSRPRTTIGRQRGLRYQEACARGNRPGSKPGQPDPDPGYSAAKADG